MEFHSKKYQTLLENLANEIASRFNKDEVLQLLSSIVCLLLIKKREDDSENLTIFTLKNKNLPESIRPSLKFFFDHESFFNNLIVKIDSISATLHEDKEKHLINAYNLLMNEFILQYNRGIKEYQGICSLLINILNVDSIKSLWDPDSGIGFRLLTAKKLNPDIKLWSQVHPNHWYHVQKLFLYINNLHDVTVYRESSLVQPKVFENMMDAVVILPFSLFSKEKINPEPQNYKLAVKTELHEEMLLQLGISRLNTHGKLSILMPESFLNKSASKNLRKYLLDNDLLEGIITLPTWYFNKGIKNSFNILTINKDKPAEHRNQVFLMDAGKMSYAEQSQGEHENMLSVVRIMELYHSRENGHDGGISRGFVSFNQIDKTNLNLLPLNYIHPVLEKIAQLKRNKHEIEELRTICRLAPVKKAPEKKQAYPFIEESILSTNPVDFRINLEMASTLNHIPQQANFVDFDALLLSARSKNMLKPSFFKYEGTGVLVDKDCFILTVDQNKVMLEHLIFQLHSDMIIQQLELLRNSENITISDILDLCIEVPSSLGKQQAMVNEMRQEFTGNYLLTSFMNEVNLVTSNHDLKLELQRFSRKYFPFSNQLDFVTEMEFDSPPFSAVDIENKNFIKHSDKDNLTYILLNTPDKKAIGILTVDKQDIAHKSYSEINAYANFLLKLKEHITKKVANDNLARFAHTTKNFFSALQGQLLSLINPRNSELAKHLQTDYIDNPDFIEYKSQKDKVAKETFLAMNKLKQISEDIKSISRFYLRTDENFKNIVNSDLETFDLIHCLAEIKEISGPFELSTNADNYYVYAKKAAITQALLDLIQNSLSYSPDKTCRVSLNDLGQFAQLTIENTVSDILPRDRYERFGREWIKRPDGKTSSGIYWAFQSIEDSYGFIELSSYDEYCKNKAFRILIKLKK